jgi:murein DD-endopeptidase MepM/ murein hydrolase activator NlpD
MRQFVLNLSVLCFAMSTLAQKKIEAPVKIYYEQDGQDILVYADNEGFCPFTIDLNMELKNMESDKGTSFMHIIAGKTQKELIATLSIVKKNANSGFNFRTGFYFGDAVNTPPQDHIYQLPYQKGERYLMSQGYNGSFSHQGENSLDFTMPSGTKICAARGGIVVDVKEDSNRGCPEKRCLDDANNILIYHEDGTFSEYAHLKRKGSLVKPGDQVKTGEVIGYSGDTGFSSGPHLHFEVFYYEKDKKITVPTQFNLEGGKTDYLEEGFEYMAFEGS